LAGRRAFGLTLGLLGCFAWWSVALLLAIPPHFSQSVQPHRFRRIADTLACSFGARFDSGDGSLKDLVSDLESLLGPVQPVSWDWTSLVHDLLGIEHSYLRENALPLPPLPPSLTVNIVTDLVGVWSWLGFIHAALWDSLWGLELVPPRSVLAVAFKDAHVPSTFASSFQRLNRRVAEILHPSDITLVSFTPDRMDSSMRLIFELCDEEYEDRLQYLRNSFDADAALSSCLSMKSVSFDSISRFLASFNPALAGMRWLITERLDRLTLKRCPPLRRVSVDLHHC
jgi:hypothetical protein